MLAAEEYSDLILQLGMFQSCFGCIQVVPTAPRLEAGLFFTALEQGIAGLRVKKVSYTCFFSGTEELRPPYTSRTRKAGKRNVYSVCADGSSSCLCSCWQSFGGPRYS